MRLSIIVAMARNRVIGRDDLSVIYVAGPGHGGPALVDIITQPLQDARAPVSEWVA